MHNMNQHTQRLDNGIEHFIPECNGHQDSGYHNAADKIGGRSQGNKTGIDYEMMETFYVRLLPVTCRDWKCKQ